MAELSIFRHLVYPLLSIFSFGLAHRLIDQYLLQPLSKWYIPSSSFQKQDSAVELTEKESKIKQSSNREKFVIAGWRFIHYSMSVVVGYSVLAKKEWLWNPSHYFHSWPQKMSFEEEFYYYYGFGLYGYGIYDLFTQKKQKDFSVMLTHHMTTLSLLGLSYVCEFHRIGSVILLCHDLADPFMEMAKICLYGGKEMLANAFFATFALVFIYTRNWVFPRYIIGALPAYHDDGRIIPYGNPWPISVAIFLLCLLALMHVYWSFLILSMIKKAIFSNGVQGDIRDEDE